MTDKLSLYNGALREIGQNKLASLTEEGVARRALDDVFDSAVNYCLEQGQWTFATRTVRLEASPSIDPAFGYQYAFQRPDDMIAMLGVFQDEYCKTSLDHYDNEADRIYTDTSDIIYLRYISNNSIYGINYSKWSASFVKYVELYLGSKISKVITGSKPIDKEELREALSIARKNTLQEKPAKRLPRGEWSSARTRSYSNWNRR